MFIAPAEKREAISRLCLVRKASIQSYITGFLAEHAERYTLVWDEVRRTLQLGFYIKDPARGLTCPKT